MAIKLDAEDLGFIEEAGLEMSDAFKREEEKIVYFGGSLFKDAVWRFKTTRDRLFPVFRGSLQKDRVFTEYAKSKYPEEFI